MAAPEYLITQTLLGAWLYSLGNEYDGAYNDFLRTLRREPGEQTEAMIEGIEFEDHVYDLATGYIKHLPFEHSRWEKGAKLIADRIRGAQIQVSVYRTIEVEGVKFLLHGKLDALRAGTIYDVKKLSKSFGSAELAGKYLNSPQHPAYFYLVPEATTFEYDVSDGEDLYTEIYTRENTRFIGDIIKEFKQYLELSGLWELYTEKWRAKE